MVSNSNNETQVDNLANTKKILYSCVGGLSAAILINVYVTGQN